MILAENIKQILSASGFLCTVEKDIPYGKQLRLPTGTIVNSYDTGKVTVHGKSVEQVQKVLIGSTN